MGAAQELDLTYVEQAGTYHTKHDWEGEREVSDTILEAIQLITGTLPTEPSLWTAIEPDALDHLFKPHSDTQKRTTGILTFEYNAITITLYPNGNIELEPDPPSITHNDPIEPIS